MSDPATSIEHGWVSEGGRCVAYTLRDHRVDRRARPRILVVIPCYKAQRWIAECLSALAANSEPHDVLIVEDGGTPLDGIAPSPNLVHTRMASNVGLIAVLNFAARYALAEGYEYYVRQDADDFSATSRLEKQRALAEASRADLVVSGVEVVDEAGAPLWTDTTSLPSNLRNALATRNIFVHSTWFLRTALFARIGCYDNRYPGAEDFELLQRIVREGVVRKVAEPLVTYRVHRSSILSASHQPAWTTVRVLATYFNPRSFQAYLGLFRSFSAAIVPRRFKLWARRAFGEISG